MAFTFARNEIEAGRALIVHCRQGKDRTGLFMAYYLKMQYGLSTSEAISRVMTARPIALSAQCWDQFAVEILDACVACD